MKHVLVTGASTGIGYATCVELLKRGFSVFGSVRNPPDAERLAKTFGSGFTPLVFDVTQEEGIRESAARVGEAVGKDGLWGLVNNAGISLPGPLSEIPASQLQKHLDVNVTGVFRVTQAFLPLLKTRPGRPHPPGRIVNISSTSGRIAFPFMGPYTASKHALEALSDAWRRDLMPWGVEVIVIQPGAIVTPIWDKASYISSAFSESPYGRILKHVDLMESKRNAVPVEKVAQLIEHILSCRRPRVRYAITRQRLKYWLGPKYLPDRWLDMAIARVMRMGRNHDLDR